MAKQLNFVETGQIIPTALHVEMERSYLEYAMSVIVGRALPDVRDGLKPVHRRILYAMYELGLTSERPFRKCARVVGDVLGKYHPHGDQSVYDALVRMVQDFSSRYPLVSGHGNFGSIDNDPAAAMRYTEARLASIAHRAILQEVALTTIDFTANFDGSQQEPIVLPAQLPILLLNGCTGIAVGMATNVPPHNLGEVVNGLIALIDNPELPDVELWKLIPAPDFPTGGEIIANSGIRDAYSTGRGSFPLRGVATIENISMGQRRKEKKVIIVSQLPYQVNKAGWIEKVAGLVNKGRLEGISDIRDESDRDGMRVVIELKRDARGEAVREQLYQQTALQVNFGAILLALVGNKPCQLSLRQLLLEFLKFREQTLRRQYNQELDQCRSRLHLLKGLLAALRDLDAVIEILRHAADGTTGKKSLQEKLALSAEQADSILAMPMRRLTGLERNKLAKEHEEVRTRIVKLENLLGDRLEFMKALKQELRNLKKKFGDKRRTQIVKLKENTPASSGQLSTSNSPSHRQTTTTAKSSPSNSNTPPRRSLASSVPSSIAKSAVIVGSTNYVAITHQGYIYKLSAEKKESKEVIKKGEDFIVAQEKVGPSQQLVLINDRGKAYPVQINNLPPVETINNLLPDVVAHCAFPEHHNNPFDLILLSEKARIKRFPLVQLANLSNRGMSLMKMEEEDRLLHVCLAREGEHMAIATSGGRVVRFAIDNEQLPVKGNRAKGCQALQLRNESLVGCVACTESADLLLVSQLGYGKRLPVNAVKIANRNNIGFSALKFTDPRDNLAGMVLAKSSTAVLWTSEGRGVRLSTDKVSKFGREETGVMVIKLKPEEKVVFVV
ncbi:MAG: DNA topoisomerase 4 subunit A [Prochloron sp. SP5CPC1]|nr:DNA topoisomerase 4 subunit A [Candidatus Paraprochloron terpiosi SP5CPC1]